MLACIGIHAVCYDTPLGIHLVFHVSFVKKAMKEPLPCEVTIDSEPGIILDTNVDPSSLAMTTDGEYAVDRILPHRC